MMHVETSLLGGMTVSAIPDVGKVVFTHGLTSTFRDGFLPMVRNFPGFRCKFRGNPPPDSEMISPPNSEK